MICRHCGYNYAPSLGDCPLCNGKWQAWELLFSSIPLDDLRNQVMIWLAQLTFPSVLEWVGSSRGLRIRLYVPPGTSEGVIGAWAAMTGQQSRWRKLEAADLRGQEYLSEARSALAFARNHRDGE